MIEFFNHCNRAFEGSCRTHFCLLLFAIFTTYLRENCNYLTFSIKNILLTFDKTGIISIRKISKVKISLCVKFHWQYYHYRTDFVQKFRWNEWSESRDRVIFVIKLSSLIEVYYMVFSNEDLLLIRLGQCILQYRLSSNKWSSRC